MTMSIVTRNDLSSGRAEFYTDKFRTVLETHMVWLRQHSTTSAITVEPHISYMYENDFNGLMNHYNVPHDLHWLNMRINELYSPLDYRQTMLTIKLVDPDNIAQLYNRYCTGYKNS